MTPARWRQIVAFFEAAQRLEPARRSEWLQLACGLDDDLRVEVGKLLAHEQRLGQDTWAGPPPGAGSDAPAIETIAGADPPAAPRSPAAISESVRLGLTEAEPSGRTVVAAGFTPRSAIAPREDEPPPSESQSVSRQRLRALAMCYLGLTVLLLVWRNLALRNPDPVLTILNGAVMLALGWLIVRLSGRRPLAPGRLRAMELALIGVLAGMVAVSHYRNLLAHSLRDDAIVAQLVMQHTVLVISVLIVSYGIYAPRSWLQVAAVVTLLALLPYATLGVLQLHHPEVMTWLRQLPSGAWITPFFSSGFDATLLLVLAAGSTYATYKTNRLRRQVVAARRLGQYHLGPRIGAGGMGEVYMAEHQFLKRPCALKLVHPDCQADPKVLERFEREVRLTATLSHWNTVEIYDYGRSEDGTYYYVMEYLPGLSLSEMVQRYGPLPPERVVYLLRQVCMALREAHAAGLV